MLLNNIANDGDVTMFNTGLTTNYGITVNGKAFRILSDTLYQNKIGSIVRELSSNASDSHIAAGKHDMPFEIHLPDAIEPYFSVRDFGVGMSDEQIRKNYCTLFESTKDCSNDQVGAFGLGSKTPFAYIDNFTIISNYNGVRRSYGAVIEANGVPVVTELSCEDTDQCNGIEIIIAVESVDHRTFRNEVAHQLRFFDTKPIIVNDSNFVFENIELDNSQIIGQFTLSNKLPYRESKHVVVQGGVGYPLDTHQVAQKMDVLNINKDVITFFNSLVRYQNSIIRFNIGEIEVTPSRENISYSGHTITSLVAAITFLANEYSKSIEEKLDSLNNDWERMVYVNSTNSPLMQSSIAVSLKYSHICKNYNTTGGWNTEKIMVKVNREVFDSVKNEKIIVTEENETMVRRYIASAIIKNRTAMIRELVGSHNIEPNENVVLIVNDKPTHWRKRITYHYNYASLRHKTVYIFERREGVFSEDDITYLSKSFGGANIIKASSFALPERDKIGNDIIRNYKSPKSWYITSHKAPNNVRAAGKMTESIDYNKKVYYITSNTDGDIDYGELNDFVNFCPYFTSFILNGEHITIIREKDENKILNNPNWICLQKNMKSLALEYIKKNFITYVKNRLKFYYKENFDYALSIVAKVDSSLLRNNPELHLMNLIRKIKYDYNTDNLSKFGFDIEKKIKERVEKRKLDFEKKYPLFAFTNFSYCKSKEMNHLIDYCNMIDKMKNIEV